MIKFKYSAAFLGAAMFLSAALPVQASSLTQTQISAIVGLLQAFGTDSTTIANVQAILVGSKLSSPPFNACVNLSRNLTRGSRGNDVINLQNYLLNKGYLDSGYTTGYYGYLTVQAVGKLQVSLSILNSSDDPAYGLIGPITRKAIGCLATPATFSATPTSGPAPLTVTFTYPSGTLDYGDGSSSLSGVNNYCQNSKCGQVVKIYNTPGTYTAKVLDSSGNVVNSATITVTTQNTGSLTISGIDAPAALAIGQSGTWTVHVGSSGSNTNLHYSVLWGDEVPGQTPAASTASVQQSATFTHVYKQTGLYTPTFTVSNGGNSARTSASVAVAPAPSTATIPSLSDLQLSSWVPTNNFSPVLRRGATAGDGTSAAAVGYNEEFIWGYAQTQAISCSDCSTNSPPMQLTTAQNYLDTLLNNSVRAQREIMPVEEVANPAFYPVAAVVLKEYQKRNFTLILALGLPVPVSMTGTASSWCPIPGTASSTDTGSYNMSAAFAQFMLYMKGRTDIDQRWLASNVLIEPFNEFDSLCGYGGSGQQLPDGQAGTPQKGARLQGIMQRVFTGAGITNEISAPSIVNGGPDVWMRGYYAAGGSGRPSVHFYPSIANSSNPVNDALTQSQNTLSAVAQATPAVYQGKILVGEIGYPDQSAGGNCTPAVPSVTRSLIYTGLVKSSTTNTNSDLFLFWRLFDQNGLPGNTGCDQYYGVVTNAWQGITAPNSMGTLGTFTQAGLDVFTAIKQVLTGTPTPTCTLSISSPAFSVGKLAATLSWTASNATQASIDNNIGALASVSSGSMSIVPIAGAIYNLTVQGTGGSGHCQTTPSSSITLPTNRDAFVTHLYECILMRDPENQTAVTSWDTLPNLTFSQMYHHFFDSAEYINDNTSDAAFATQMYECLLFRVPAASDVNYWIGKLGTLTLRDAELDSVLQSPEFLTYKAPTLQQATGITP